MYNEIKVRPIYEVSYTDENGEVKTERFDKVVTNRKGLFVKIDSKWGFIHNEKGFVILPGYNYLAELEYNSRSKDIIIGAKVNDKMGVLTSENKRICGFKYKKIDPKYYEQTSSFLVEIEGSIKGVVKNCKEIIPLMYHEIIFEDNLWKCVFEGLSDDYYTMSGEKTEKLPF